MVFCVTVKITFCVILEDSLSEVSVCNMHIVTVVILQLPSTIRAPRDQYF
jgi:hypothetical protein